MTEPIDTKGVQVVTADIKAAKKDDGSYDITLSVPTEDRDEEVVDAKALEWLSAGRMPIDVDHGMTVLSTVGSGNPGYDGDDLKLFDFRFASTPFAQDVKTLVDEEHISKMSVAFMAAKREKDEKDGKIHIRSAELLNAAIVAIPSNREANILVSKALAGLAKRLPDMGKVGARNSAKDAEMIQSMHDSTAALGAACEGSAKSKRDRKSVAGSYEERSDRLRDSLRTSVSAEGLWIRATFDDSVIYDVYNEDEPTTTWQVSYAEDGETFTFGTPTEIDLTEIVVPPTKGIRIPAATDPEDTAAQAAVEPPAEVGVAKALTELSLVEADLALE